MVRSTGSPPTSANWLTGDGGDSARNASIAAAIDSSPGGVTISRPRTPTIDSRRAMLEPRVSLYLSIAWARNVAGTGASPERKWPGTSEETVTKAVTSWQADVFSSPLLILNQLRLDS